MPPIPERVTWAVDLLGATAPETLLEVGCGNGAAIALVCERFGDARLTGLERSATAIAAARERLEPYVAAGRVSLVHGAVEGGGLRDRFARIFAINVNVYWTRPEVAFAATRRLLAPGGLLQLVYEPPTGKLPLLERQLTDLLAANAWEIESRHTSRFRSGAGLALVVRPRRA